jgi:hypothetical protein
MKISRATRTRRIGVVQCEQVIGEIKIVAALPAFT